jgi:hypothetical protein
MWGKGLSMEDKVIEVDPVAWNAFINDGHYHTSIKTGIKTKRNESPCDNCTGPCGGFCIDNP